MKFTNLDTLRRTKRRGDGRRAQLITLIFFLLPALSAAEPKGGTWDSGWAAPGGNTRFYSQPAAEGNYRVRVRAGDPHRAAVTTIKAELRRLMMPPIATRAGEYRTVEFIVNVRTPRLAEGGVVRLKPREKTGEIWDWDDRLTLEFDGDGPGPEHAPAVASVEIIRAGPMPTVYLAGDSTVCDQPYEPFCSWGQMLPRFFGPTVAIANHAESGESIRSFYGERRMAKLDERLKPGDYLFIQFGHNDQKEKGLGDGAMTSYRRELERMVDDARSRGATPVVITPVSRRTFGDDGRIKNSLGDFPLAVRTVARERRVALIDLNAATTQLYEALGPQGAVQLFPVVHGVPEGTHHNDYGAYEIARCVAQAIRDSGLPLKSALLNDTPPFDPSHPDAKAAFDIPPSPMASEEKPYGN